jgi:hypothetical protein
MDKIDVKYINLKFPIGTCIHKTRYGNMLKIVKITNEKIFFTIPNHKDVNKPYEKSISIEIIIKIYENIDYDFKKFPFTDCRKSAAKGIITNLKK